MLSVKSQVLVGEGASGPFVTTLLTLLQISNILE